MTDNPGLHPLETALDQEGFEEHGANALVESFARHLMAAIDTWQQEGFEPLMKDYVKHLSPEKGTRRNIDENGDLIVRWVASDQVDRRPLRRALEKQTWYDKNRKGPR